MLPKRLQLTLIGSFLLPLAAFAATFEVELRLVAHDQPDVSLEKLEKQRPITDIVPAEHGMETRQVGLDLTCWARNVLLDGESVFERYHEGKYIGRLPIARPRLKTGDHTLWPGDHVFTLDKDGKITTADPELRVDGQVVRVKCYPVTIRAYRANPDEADLPMSMRTTPLPDLTVRESADHQKNAFDEKRQPGKPRDLLPVFDKFAPLTIWLPGNKAGKGYLIHPLGLTLHLGAEGIVPGAGGGQSVEGLRVQKNLIEIPLYGYPVEGPVGGKLVIPGVEQFIWGGHDKGRRFLTNWYPRQQPYEVQIADPGPALRIEGSLRSLPIKRLKMDVPDRAKGIPRALAVEIATRHLTAGGALAARVRAIDATRANEASRPVKEAEAMIAKAAEALNAARAGLNEAKKAGKGIETAEAESAAAEKPLKDAQALREARIPERDAAAKENPLESASPFAQLQPYEGGQWADLELKAGKDGQVRAAIPTVPDGVYRLRLGIRPVPLPPGEGRVMDSEPGAAPVSGTLTLPSPGGRGKDSPPLFTEQWVSIASKRPVGLGLFTQRGRDAFFRGEGFWIGLGVIALAEPLPAGSPIEADLLDQRGQRIPLLRDKLQKPVEKRETFVIHMDPKTTLDLAPGRYRVEAKVGAHTCRPLSLDIVDPTPRTHFANVMVGKYNVMGDQYLRVLRTGEGAEELAREIVAMGCNTFIGMTYDISRIYRRDLDLEQLVRERPELGPWESYYQPSGRDRFLNACVRNNLRFFENIFTYNDTMLPREPKILDACERYMSLEVASMRHSPALRGTCLYDEFYDSADTGTAMSQMFYKAQEIAYREKHKGLTSAAALKALDRFVGRPVGQRRPEDLATFRTWLGHQDSDWREFSARMARAAKAVMPSARNLTLQRFWGGNGGDIAPCGTSEDVFGDLDIAACVMYKDGGYGDRPVFAPMQADVMRVRDGLPVWTQLHTFHAPALYGDHVLRQAFFALSQNVQGLTFFTIQHDYEHPETIDNRDTVRDIAGTLCTRYGDLFAACQKGYKRVAVYYSREADHLASRKPENLPCTCEGLWVACMRAGFPADFLYDHQIRAGKGMEYDVIFAPGLAYEDEASADILAALKRLVGAGKTIAVERGSKLPIEGIVRLDSDLDEYDDKLGGAFPRNIDFESEMVWDQTEETTKLVREFLSKRIPPAAAVAASDSPLQSGCDWLRCGKAEYLIVPNFAYTKFTGLYKTLYQAPDRPTLRFPKRPPVCYDMLEMKRVEAKTESATRTSANEEWMTLQADLRHYPGKVYAFLPAAIGRLELQASRTVQAGSDLNYQVTVLDEAGKPIDAGFPVQITVQDPTGVLFQGTWRAATPQYRGACRLPVNAPTGTWKLRVRELISGAFAEAPVELTTGQTASAKLDSQTVWVHDPERIAELLARPQALEAAGGCRIAVDGDQPWVKKHAERLAQALTARGIQAKVVSVAEAVRLPVDWDNEMPTIDGSRLWRGNVVDPGLFVDAPLILLGKRFENRLIEALVRRDVLPEPLSANFPGPGRAIVAWARRAFSNHYDTVALLANDDEGLSRGIEALLALGREGEAPAAPFPVHPTATQPTPDPAAQLTPAGTHAAAPTSYRDAISREDLVRALDLDPATGRILVGTNGFGHNLFCFASDGKLLWKQFLPEHNVYLARWYDGGKRVLAATGRGFYVFLLDGADGRVLKKFAATEWPLFHGGFTVYQEGAINTEVQIAVNPPLRQIFIGGLTGIMAVDFDGKKMWFRDRTEAIAAYPPEAEQTVAAEFGRSAFVGDFALSPDGSRLVHGEYAICGSTRIAPDKIANVWKYVPMALDARTGQVLCQNTDDPGNQTSPGGWHVSWPTHSETPWIHSQGVAFPLLPDGKRGPFITAEGRWLKDGGQLVSTPTSLERLAADGRSLWQVSRDRIWVPGFDTLDDEESKVCRCDRDGLVVSMDMKDGRLLWEHKLPFPAVLRPTGDGLLAGAQNGTIIRLDAAGKLLWHTRLRDHHEVPEGNYPAYIAAALERDPDATEEFFPVGRDKPGDYDSILRMGMEQLTNPGFESQEGWASKSADVRLVSSDRTGGKALALAPGQLVTQPLKRKVVPSATYLLEFFYRVQDGRTRLIAGALLAGARETLPASKFAASPGEWAFGRLTVKTLADTKSIEVGFEAEGGPVLVDDASLRPVRFPSANLLANAELHALEPTFVRDIRVQYNRVPASLKEKLRSQNHVVALKQGLSSGATRFTQEEAYLHNGRLDDVGPVWVYQPDNVAFSIVLIRTAYISHLVLYLNNATPDNVYRTLSILANNLETKMPEAVALVRCNRRRFIVVHFPKLLHTDSIKILPGIHRARQECLTEVELYGPLGGPEMAQAGKGFAEDPDALPMLMFSPSHVPGKLPADLLGEYGEVGRVRTGAPAYHVGATVVHGAFAYGEANGSIRSIVTREPDPKEKRQREVQWGPTWAIGTITPTTTPARYAGRLLVGSADYKLHAVADNGLHLWSYQTGGRVYSSPTPDGDEVYFGSDDGRLYKVDVDSGLLLWEFATGDKIRSSPALADGRLFVASWDGFLYAVEAARGTEVWKAPIAKYTRSSPAVHKGRVYVGDEQGRTLCFDAASGKPFWQQDLGGYISICPVVTDDGVFFASDQGHAALVGSDGSVRWKRELGARLSGQPFATQSQLLVPTESGLLVLRRADGQPDTRFAAPENPGKIIAAVPYGQKLFLLAARAEVDSRVPPRTYVLYEGTALLWAPKPKTDGAK